MTQSGNLSSVHYNNGSTPKARGVEVHSTENLKLWEEEDHGITFERQDEWGGVYKIGSPLWLGMDIFWNCQINCLSPISSGFTTG